MAREPAVGRLKMEVGLCVIVLPTAWRPEVGPSHPSGGAAAPFLASVSRIAAYPILFVGSHKYNYIE